MPYQKNCDKCGEMIELQYGPVENRAVYCKRCFIVISEEEIEAIVESFNKITDEEKLKEAIEFLAFKESQLIVAPTFKNIRRKDKRDEILRLLRVEEVKRRIVN